MTKQSVNQAFILLDKTTEDKKKLSAELNSHSDSPHFFGNQTSYNPDDRNYGTSTKINDLLWRTDKPDHNGYYTVFMFRTTEKYPDNRTEAEAEIMKTSELRKTLLKNDIAEVGITIEESLRRPTETCWGWTFGGYKYYIIKDNKLTITEQRSVIRKIYNNKPLENDNPYKVRLEDHNNEVSEYEYAKTTKEIEELYEVSKGVFHCEIDYEPYFLGTDDSMREYFCEYIMDEEMRETLIHMLGGKEAMIKHYLGGGTFQPDHLLYYDEGKNFCSILDIDREWHEANEIRIENSDFDSDNELKLCGLKLYKKNF